MKYRNSLRIFCVVVFSLLVGAGIHSVSAQGTAFTYQGKLTDSGNLANGNYDLQFKLFDTAAVGTGTQQGTTQFVLSVTVTNGIFTVQLDLGACPACFDGSARFLEIAIKPTSGSTFTTLGPRQPLTSTPYALKSQNATTADGLSLVCVSCVTSSQIQSVQGSQVTGNIAGNQINGAIPVTSVPAGSTNYIQNGTSPQAASNFNISGTGTSDILNATTRYNLNGQQVLSAAGSSNLFAGINAGASNTGTFNAFFGSFAGNANTTGFRNSFFGASAGAFNTTGSQNAFFGREAGESNTTGIRNSFFGDGVGLLNTTGNGNAFFGAFAGQSNTSGQNNTLIGISADFNAANSTGSNNTLLGANAVVTSGTNNSTAIGANAQVTQSNSLVLGNNVNVGVGTTAPTSRLHVVGDGLFTGNLTVNGTLTASLPAGSASYIQNTTNQQAASNFNISGTGTANIFNATTRYNLNGQSVLSAGANNLFAGINAGTTGSNNAFFGAGAGQANTTGFNNAFFGTFAGNANTTGQFNAFFGYQAGQANTTGFQNAFFGNRAGQVNTTGNDNAFFGAGAGQANTTGGGNAFFGVGAGISNTTGIRNAFFGENAGFSNTTGSDNTFIGIAADFDITNPTGDQNTLLGDFSRVTSGISNATAIGFRAQVTQSNSLVLGGITGVNGGTDTNVGIGTTAPTDLLTIGQPEATVAAGRVGIFSPSGLNVVLRETTSHVEGIFGVNSSSGVIYGSMTNHAVLFRTNNTNRIAIATDGSVGIGTTTPADKLDVSGDVRVGTSGTNGCLKNNNGGTIVGTCSSDVRFKRDITPFANLLSRIVQLRPVYFYWRSEHFPDRHFGQSREAGLIAQEVEKVMPELVSEDEQGYKAVNYSKLPLLSLQAIKELKQENDTLKRNLSEQQALTAAQQQQLTQQQARFAKQEQQLSQQQQELAAIKNLLCQSQPQADLCKVKSVK